MKFDKLFYQFHDSSVPPEYHRNYDISITKNKIIKIIYSYGDNELLLSSLNKLLEN